MARLAALVGVAFGLGARDPGCAAGPERLLEAGPPPCLRAPASAGAWMELLRPPRSPSALAAAAVAVEALEAALAPHLALRRRAVVVGGDHSLALGTWRALARARGPLGLLWVDAHLDAHTPRTTPSGALHGMPLACLLGTEGGVLEPLCPPYPALDLERVCVLGARSFEPPEARLLARLGVRVLGMGEVVSRGLAACWAEALERVAQGPYGVSVDLDAVDPDQAPGVGTPEPGGLDGEELVRALAGLRADPELGAVELMEYHPGRDREGRTLALLQRLLCAALPWGEEGTGDGWG